MAPLKSVTFYSITTILTVEILPGIWKAHFWIFLRVFAVIQTTLPYKYWHGHDFIQLYVAVN